MLSTDNLPTSERSLLAALEVVREEGFGELTTRAIARRSGLTQPAIYRHFADKDELVSRVLGEIRDMFYQRLVQSAKGPNALSQLTGALEAFRDFAIAEPRLYDALFFQTDDGAVQPPPIDPDKGGNIFGYLVDRVRDCSAEGMLTGGGPVGAALTLVAHVQGLVLLYRQGRFGSEGRFARFFEQSIGDLIDGMT